MKLSFRWFGSSDPISLQYIRQIPRMHTIVSAIYDAPVGEVWSHASIAALRNAVVAAGLSLDVVESVPVHEDIKLGLPSRDTYIAAYCENIRRLGAHGVKVICYNFMPVFDWTRTDTAKALPDGSTCLSYDAVAAAAIDPLSTGLRLPGWDESYTKDELRRVFAAYASVDAEQLWDNLAYFLRAVIPVAAACGVKMAIHPDDPPYPIFGLPRIITDAAALDRLLGVVDDVHNGVTLCTGSLGCDTRNDVVAMAERYAAAGRIHFVHARNVVNYDDGSFDESPHPCGSLDLRGVMAALRAHDYDGYIRPDHGRMIWGESGKPGYGLYDRALGAAYLLGLWDGAQRIQTD